MWEVGHSLLWTIGWGPRLWVCRDPTCIDHWGNDPAKERKAIILQQVVVRVVSVRNHQHSISRGSVGRDLGQSSVLLDQPTLGSLGSLGQG